MADNNEIIHSLSLANNVAADNIANFRRINTTASFALQHRKLLAKLLQYFLNVTARRLAAQVSAGRNQRFAKCPAELLHQRVIANAYR